MCCYRGCFRCCKPLSWLNLINLFEFFCYQPGVVHNMTALPCFRFCTIFDAYHMSEEILKLLPKFFPPITTELPFKANSPASTPLPVIASPTHDVSSSTRTSKSTSVCFDCKLFRSKYRFLGSERFCSGEQLLHARSMTLFIRGLAVPAVNWGDHNKSVPTTPANLPPAYFTDTTRGALDLYYIICAF